MVTFEETPGRAIRTWVPALEGEPGPRYLAIADAIERAIESGELKPGDQLAPHRILADALGLTVGTITRAYREAERRALLLGQVGRGTYVQDPKATSIRIAQVERGTSDQIDLSHNFLRSSLGERAFAATLSALAGEPLFGLIDEYKPVAGSGPHREAGAAYLGQAGLQVSTDQVMVCAGGQHALFVALGTCCRPGDLLLVEEATYPGVRAAARFLSLELKGVEMDSEGVIPEALQEICKKQRPRALYTMPNIQNPTTVTMSAKRRIALAEVLERHQLMVIEDDVYGFLLDNRPPPLASLLPEASCFLTSLAKSVAPGLRIGYLMVPSRHKRRAEDISWATTFMASPLLAELAARWQRDGTYQRAVEERREETRMRRALAKEILRGFDLGPESQAYHLWLRLPAQTSPESLVAEAMSLGVIVSPSSAFTIDPNAPPALRIALGAAQNHADLRRGLLILRAVLGGEAPRPVV